MSEGPDNPRESGAPVSEAPGSSASATPGTPPASAPTSAGSTPALVDQLVARFVDQLQRALGVELRDDIGVTALAYVDHYLALVREETALAREETREPIISLVAAGAGAWFGELVRAEIGGQWIGDGADPRRLRLLLEPQFLHFSPIDLAYEAIFSGSPDPDDPRIPAGAALDGAYHLRKRSDPNQSDPNQEELDDHAWVSERLAEAAPVPEDLFYSLTGRFETLELILGLLAGRDVERGREPTRYHLNDYVAVLTG